MKTANYTHLPLIALRAFEAAGRLGTMTAAAEELCVTPGAVSRQVRQLEEFLSVKLFTGSKNKPVLTQKGVVLLPILSSALSQMLAGINSIKSKTHNVVDVSCLNTFAMRWLIPRLYCFNDIHPTIEVRLSTTSLDNIPTTNHDVIIGIQSLNEAVIENETIVLFEEKLGPVMAASMANQHSIATPKDLAHLAILQTRTRPNAWSTWCHSIGESVTIKPGTTFEHYYFTLEAALSGLGICIAPEHLVMDDIKSQRLLAPLGFIESSYAYTVNMPPSSHQGANQFVAWLREQSYSE
jgi:DNA-binding transcriptional LysR family regulator